MVLRRDCCPLLFFGVLARPNFVIPVWNGINPLAPEPLLCIGTVQKGAVYGGFLQCVDELFGGFRD